jgi:hypothetical protein
MRLDLSGAVRVTATGPSDLSSRVPKAWSRPFALAEGTRDPLILTITTLSAAYTACGCGYGGTRNRSTSRSVQA